MQDARRDSSTLQYPQRFYSGQFFPIYSLVSRMTLLVLWQEEEEEVRKENAWCEEAP